MIAPTKEHLAQARETNRHWLESWGCTVRQMSFCTVVSHPEFDEFNAIYDLSDPQGIENVLTLAATAFPPRQNAAIYIPLDSEYEIARARLTRLGYRPEFRSDTLAAQVSMLNPGRESGIELLPVTADKIDQWIGLYQENYGTPPEQASAEMKRWRETFLHADGIRFYFIQSDSAAVGTAQLVAGPNEWCGLYAISIRRALRGIQSLARLSLALINEVKNVGCEWVFFDRLRPTPSQPTRSLISHRPFPPGWRGLSAEIGFRRPVDPLQ